MAKGGSKKQSKLSPTKGQMKISSFFSKSQMPASASTSVSPSASASPSASGSSSIPALIVISDDDDDCNVTPSRSSKRKLEEASPAKSTASNLSADFVDTTPVTQIQRKKSRRKIPTTPKSSSPEPDSGFPVTSPEHMIFSYVTKVLKIENAFKIEPKRLFRVQDNLASDHKLEIKAVKDPMPSITVKSIESLTEPSKQIPTSSVTLTDGSDPNNMLNKGTELKNDSTNTSPSKQSKLCSNIVSSEESASKTAISTAANHSERSVTKAPNKSSAPDEASSSDAMTDKGVPSSGSVNAMFEDLLLDEWDLGDAFAPQPPLDLSALTRCVVLSAQRTPHGHLLSVAADGGASTAATNVLLRLPWSECVPARDDIVSLQARRTEQRDLPADGTLRADWTVDSNAGMLVLMPDTLLSTTVVMGSLFCARKTVLATLFPGGDPANRAMLVGNVAHQLAQSVLSAGGVATAAQTLRLSAQLLESREHVTAMFATDVEPTDVGKDVAVCVPHIVAFANGQTKGSGWSGRVTRVADIEENVWSPRLGLKGRLDVTAELEESGPGAGRRFVGPVELKTGRASHSAEHRGQVMLYQAMLADLGLPAPAGLLFYLREGSVERVSATRSEQAGLVSLRNRLVPFLARPRRRLTAPAAPDAPDAVAFPAVALPEPINHHNACARCPHLTLCSLVLRQEGLERVEPGNPLLALIGPSTEHLSPSHIEYFQRWIGLILLEDSENRDGCLSDLWTRPASQRPRCHADMRVAPGAEPGNVCRLIGQRTGRHAPPPLKEGDYVAISSDTRPAIYQGSVTSCSNHELVLLLDRPVLARHAAAALHVDVLPVGNSAAWNLGLLRVLLGDSPRAAALRAAVIDRATPTFSKLPRSLLQDGAEVFATLNQGQRAAVLRALSADSFLLIKGMPGSGKTHTVAALVSLLAAAGKSVLLTSHTHSAVDTLLLKVMSRGVPVLRLGSVTRVNPALVHRGEAALLGHCTNPQQLGADFKKLLVVGCTCLGANHPLIAKRRFDVCIVDESTQVVQTTVLRALAAADCFVLVGDPDQLAPVVRHRQARALGMDQSLFARLDGAGATAALDLQYRMNGCLTALANAVTYAGQLRCANPQVEHATLATVCEVPSAAWLTLALSTHIDDSVVFYDTGRTCRSEGAEPREAELQEAEPSVSNEREASVVLAVAQALRSAGVPGGALGVMATYRAQVALLARLLGDAGVGADVSTIDQFQGRDKEVVLLSCTRSDRPEHVYLDQAGELLGDARRLTVAVTRARHKLVVVGDADTLANFAPFARLLRSLPSRVVVRLRDGQDGFHWP